MPTDLLSQYITPPLRRGEDATLVITGTFSADPSAWATRLSVKLAPADTPVTVTGPAPVVTGPVGGVYTAAWSCVVPAATSTALSAGLNSWEHARTDAGSHEVLAAGTVLVLDGVTDYP